MEYIRGSRYVPEGPQLQEDSLRVPVTTGPSGGSPSKCVQSVSKVVPNLCVALLLLSTGLLMYSTRCSFSMLLSMENDSSSESPLAKSARFESTSTAGAAEIRLHRRLRGIAQSLSMSPAAEVQVHYDVAPPSALELLPKDSLPDLEVRPSRGLAQEEQVDEGGQRWASLGFQQKLHPMPNGPDPIHNRGPRLLLYFCFTSLVGSCVFSQFQKSLSTRKVPPFRSIDTA